MRLLRDIMFWEISWSCYLWRSFSWEYEFIGAFFAFLEIQTAMVVEFYGVIHAIKEAQKMRLSYV